MTIPLDMKYIECLVLVHVFVVFHEVGSAVFYDIKMFTDFMYWFVDFHKTIVKWPALSMLMGWDLSVDVKLFSITFLMCC